MRICRYAGIVFLAVVLPGCALGPDERMENPSDPLSPVYVPPAPKYLYADLLSDTVAIIQWYGDAASEQGYRLYRNSELDTAFRLIGVIPAGKTWFTDTDPKAPGVRHNYRIYSYSGARVSRHFADTWFRYVLLPPTDVSISPSSPSRRRLGWRNASSFLTATHIERDAGTGFETIGMTAVGAVAFLDTSAVQSQLLIYRLTARTHYHGSAPVVVQYRVGG